MNKKQIRLRSREEVQDFVQASLVTVILILIFPMTA